MSTSKKQMLALIEDLTRYQIIPCFDEKSLHALTLTCKNYQKKYKNTYQDKKVAAEMLHCVLNPTESNQKRFLELITEPKKDLNGPPLYLIQNHGEEVYFNKAKVKKTKRMRWNTNVLEAILRTGNFHLAKTLFNSIPKAAKTDALKQQIRDIKAKGIWGMSELQTAYKNFLDPWKALYDAKKGKELNRLSGLIGLAQKEHLPWFSLYLFCHPGTHANANYTLAPNWVCILIRNAELDLDLFDVASINALYKGSLPVVACGERGGWEAAPQMRMEDSVAFYRQCEVLSSEMDKAIKEFGLHISNAASKPHLR